MATKSPASRRDVAATSPVSPVVAAMSPRRLRDVPSLAGTSPAVVALSHWPGDYRWRLESPLVAVRHLRDVSWRLAGSPGSRGKFKHVRFLIDFSPSPAGLGDVSTTSPRPAGDVAATSPQSPWSPAGLGDVAETSPRLAGDWKMSPKEIEHASISRDSPETRIVSRRRHGDVAETRVAT